MNLQVLNFLFLILYINKKLIFFYFVELYFSDFLSVKFLLILHFRFFSSFLSVKYLFILHFRFFSSFLSVNLNFFLFHKNVFILNI